MTSADAVVVDASAICAVLFGESTMDHVVDRVAGRRIVAPTLLRYEVASTAWKKQRRDPARADLLRWALELYTGLEVDELPVPVTPLPGLAEDAGLTTYDAAYLWLARSLGLELVTLDRGLAEAAGAAPVES